MNGPPFPVPLAPPGLPGPPGVPEGSPLSFALAPAHVPLEDGEGGLELLRVRVRLLGLGLQGSDLHADGGVRG
eukprot:5332179-Alexandrium_andersonii.AAC.1